MFEQLSRETYALVEEKVPFGKVVAPVITTLLIAAVGLWALLFIYREGLKPIAETIGTIQSPSSSWLPLLVVFAILSASQIIAWLMIARRLDAAVARARHDTALRFRLLDCVEEKPFHELSERVTALESHTDISGLRNMIKERLIQQGGHGGEASKL